MSSNLVKKKKKQKKKTKAQSSEEAKESNITKNQTNKKKHKSSKKERKRNKSVANSQSKHIIYRMTHSLRLKWNTLYVYILNIYYGVMFICSFWIFITFQT